MRRYTNILLIMALLVSMGLWAGCGGKANMGPKWFLNPPDDSKYIYGAAMDTSSNMQYAIDKATALAREQVASSIGTKVGSLFKRFREEMGEGESPEFMSMTTSVSKLIVSEVISGSKVIKKEIVPKGKIYNAYVLVQAPTAEINAALLAKIKANQNLYTRFRASQAFKDLNEEVDKYDKFKKEQGM